MKIILLLSLISFSSLSFSNEDVSKADVVVAIKDSIEIKDLDCTQTDFKESFKASSVDLSSLQSEPYKMDINQSQQPVITFSLIRDNHEYDILITTNADFTSVKEITSTDYIITTKKINTGTIIKPHIEEKIVKKVSWEMKCK